MKPENAECAYQRDVAETYEKKRHSLAENELERTDRADHDLFERTGLALAHDRECSEAYHLYQGQGTDDAGDKEPAIVQPLVEPGERLKRNSSFRSSDALAKRKGATRLIFGELGDDLADISECDQRRVRVRSIHYHLKRRTLPIPQTPAEIRHV